MDTNDFVDEYKSAMKRIKTTCGGLTDGQKIIKIARITGWKYQRIATELGCANSVVSNTVNRVKTPNGETAAKIERLYQRAVAGEIPPEPPQGSRPKGKAWRAIPWKDVEKKRNG